MAEETLVTATDIARLAGVGRAAVSNWRRRHADFPQPVAGTPVSPLFTLAKVEAWLRGHGKLLKVPLAEQAWQELRRRAGDDLRLAAALADAGERLADGRPVPHAVAELAAASGPADALEVLVSRFHEAQARGAPVPAPEVTGLMAALTEGAATVLDPVCGTGELLLAAREHGATRLLGQDANADLARLAGARIRLGTDDCQDAGDAGHREAAGPVLRASDALLADAFAGIMADAVLCCAPPHPRTGAQDLNAADPRWVYGVPPRTEPELAWVQHAVAHLAPAGVAVVLVPQAMAARRAGRRIRAQLLRRGALRAVIALPGANLAGQLWLLRRPVGDVPTTVLMSAADGPQAAIAAWRRFTSDPGLDEPGVSRAVPVIDLLDDEVDLNPARYLSAPPAVRAAERFAETRDVLASVLSRLPDRLPNARPAGAPLPLTFVTVAELARTGYVEVYQAPTRPDGRAGPETGVVPMLTVEDVLHDRPPSGHGHPGERWVTLRAGDIAVTAAPAGLAARVVAAAGEGAILGPGLTLLRVDPARLDPHFAAGVLRSSANGHRAGRVTGSSGRADISRALIAELPPPEQRRYGQAFRRAEELRAAARTAAALGTALAQLLADGLAAGTLEPGDDPANHEPGIAD